MYEHKKQALASKAVYIKRIRKNILFAIGILFFSLSIGVIGYKIIIPEFDWYDSLLNASMILSGMGPVVTIQTNAGKLFSSFYAIFSGVVFITSISILIAPTAHRFFHSMNLED